MEPREQHTQQVQTVRNNLHSTILCTNCTEFWNVMIALVSMDF